MKAVVFQGLGDIRLEEVSAPKLQDQTDAIIKLTASAICGTDLHFVRGTASGMKKGTILGHEGVGIVEEIGSEVKNMSVGDRVVVCSTIACGKCERCDAEDYSQCAVANPGGRYAGTAFFGGPKASGSFNGLQAERARIPFADTVLVKLPSDVRDDQAILLSDIFPTAYFGALLAEVGPGKTVAVYGCGPVGQFCIVSAKLLGAEKIFAIDTIDSRLEAAQRLGAEIINYEKQDPIQALKDATDGAGVDCAIDAVGVDANRPHSGPAEKASAKNKKEFEKELKATAPKTGENGDNWHPGDAPTQVLRRAVRCLRGAGSLGIIGVYPPEVESFPIGEAMNKNLSVKLGNCPHRRYIPKLIEFVQSGRVDPSKVLTQEGELTQAIQAYKAFDKRANGWIKVELNPEVKSRQAA
jgi:threonine dehydrogenase-like Zn-dependent dehydrogenase